MIKQHVKYLCLLLMLWTAHSVQAGDIGSGDISLGTSYDSTTGRYQITLPVYDDNGADEGLHYNKSSKVSVTINGTKHTLCYMYSFKGDGKPQGEDSWYWVRVKNVNTAVCPRIEAKDNAQNLSAVTVSSSDYTYIPCNKQSGKSKVTLYFYLKPQYLESQGTFEVYLYVDKNEGSNYSVSKTSSSIQGLNFATPSVSQSTASTAGYQSVTVSISSTAGSRTVSIDGVSGSGTNSFSKNLAVTDNTQSYTARATYTLTGGSIAKTTSFTLPQYRRVTGLTAAKWNNGSTRLTWSTPTAQNPFIDGGNFCLQRKVQGGDWTTLSSSISSSTFSYIDENNTQTGTVQYRIYRSQPSSWGVYREATASINKNQEHAKVTAFTHAKLLSQREVELQWQWNYNASNTKDIICLTGAKFIINREVSYDGETFSTDTDGSEELDCSDFMGSQTCTHKVTLPQSCTLYRWRIYLKTGSNVYPSASPIYPATFLMPDKDPSTGLPTGTYQSSTLGINDKEVASLESFNASHGYYGDRVELDWKIADNSGSLDVFSVQRREYGDTSTDTNPFIQIATIQTTNGITHYSYTDTRAVPGITYEYLIEGSKECANEEVKTQDYSYGFCTATGNIYGRITFTSENGQAVQDAEVRLESTAQITGQSYRMNGNYYLEVTKATFHDDARDFSLQAFVMPDNPSSTAKASVIKKEGMYELYFQDDKVHFQAGDQTLTASQTLTSLTAASSFVQLTAVCGADTMRLYANGKEVAKAMRTASLSTTGKPFTMGKNLQGYLDEVRIWSKALSADEVAKTFDRYLAGNEDGLTAYWTFNSATAKEFYDFSQTNNKFHMNDGHIRDNSQIISAGILSNDPTHNPTLDQLGYKDYTDNDGSYYITGIPYIGNGTLYTIIPRLGTHEFSPTKAQVTLSGGSVNHNANFVDKSSFPVSGTITYKGGTIPVEGVQFFIDGVVCSDSKGNIVSSDSKGKFTISVPVGTHQVQAKLSGHTFENDGKLLDDYGNDINYQDDRYSTVKLTDITTVRYIGRVAGGPIQEKFPVGHSLSTNNLADGVTVQLTYENAAYKLYGEAAERSEVLTHFQPGNWVAQGKEPLTNTVRFRGNVVTIQPNATTGEFVADLPPLNYAVKVNVPGYDNISGNNSRLSLTNCFVKQFIDHSYTDSVLEQKQYVKVNYNDTVYYNQKQQFIARTKPVIRIEQLQNYRPVAYFGDTITSVSTRDGSSSVRLYNPENDTYTLGLPVFTQANRYTLRASIYEEYPYYNESGDPTDRISDKVPSQDAVVSFQSTMRSSNDYEDVEADSTGVATWSFVANKVDMTSATANINVKATIGTDENATSIAWTSPFDANNLVIMKGSISQGNNFITAGPDKVLAVLRDPPGTHSYSYLEKGTTFTESSSTSSAISQEGQEDTAIGVGTELVTFTGVGVGTIQSAVTNNKAEINVEHSSEWVNSSTRTSTTTINSIFQTSDDPDYVGAMADVYIGYSTNMSIGTANTIHLVEKSLYDSNPENYSTVYDVNTNDNYVLAQCTSLEMGAVFNTMFAYPQVYIQNVLLPNIEEVRNGLLHQPDEMSAARFQAEANATKKAIYVSYLSPDDENYGRSNTDPVFRNDPKWYEKSGQTVWDGPSYKVYFPSDEAILKDTIQTLNQSMDKWIERIADNERAKVEAINQGEVLQNYSFQGGSSVEYSRGYSNVKTEVHTFTFILGAKAGSSAEFNILGSGCEITFREGLQTTQGKESTTEEEATTTVGFVLAEDGDDDYLSVDVYQETGGDNAEAGYGDINSKDLNLSTFIFRTRAGATSCPYEDEIVTEYYQPGTVISEKTLQIEVPEIAVENDFIDNVPSGEPAYVTLYLRNNSATNEDGWFNLVIDDQANQLGASLRLDGNPIANGRAILVPAGETLTKILEVRKGPGLNYDNLQLVLASQCQGDPTVNQDIVADTVTFSVHFTPSCSDIAIKTPSKNWTYNTDLPTEKNAVGADVHYMNVQLTDFNVNYDNFKSIRLMYKPSSNSDENWITLMNYFNDETYYNEAVQNGMNATMIQAADKGTITYKWFLDDMPDQPYDLCAATVCVINNEEVLNFSETHSGVKDMYRPRLFGQPQPANGILTINDDAKITFNESIAAGYLTENNFSVTGIKNGTATNHDIAVETDGTDVFSSEMTRSFRGKDLTFEAWVKLPADQNATFFRHGTDDDLDLCFGLTAQRQLTVRLGGKTYTSEVITTGDYLDNWNHVAMTLDQTDDADGRLVLYFNFVPCLTVNNVPAYAGNAPYRLAEGLTGQIHNVRIWTAARTAGQLQAWSNQGLSGYETNLLSYYPMDEGRGLVLKDKARGLNLAMSGGTWILPEGRATLLNGSNSYLRLNAGSSVVVDIDGDYTMELWFKGGNENGNATLLASGRADGNDWGGSDNLFRLGFDQGTLTYRSNGQTLQATGNYLDDNWHHVAVAVNRITNRAQLYVDGHLSAYAEADGYGRIASAYIYAGVTPVAVNTTVNTYEGYFSGAIDDVRFWSLYKDETSVQAGMSNRLDGTEMGLLSYYPFETHTVTSQNIPVVRYSLADAKEPGIGQTANADATAVIGTREFATITTDVRDLVENAFMSAAIAPVRDKGGVTDLLFDFVVNNDALIITLKEEAAKIENTTVTFTVDEVRDLNGNAIASPITWTAYIDRNQLRWSEDELALEKNVDEPLNFTVDIVNQGGYAETFTISNQPSWMSVSPTEGSIAATKTQHITCEVDESVNIGTYEETLYLTNSDGVSEPLFIRLKVNGERPAWNVNPADYKYSMSIYGKLCIDGRYSNDTEDLLSAFYHNTCTGVTANQYIKQNDMYYALLTVYSNEASTDTLEFKMWDASTGTTYVASPDRRITFKANSIVGSPTQPVVFTNLDLKQLDIALNAGWTWTSFNVVNDQMQDIASTLQYNNWQNGDEIKREDGGMATYGSATGWVDNGLRSFEPEGMYLVRSSVAQTLSVVGAPVDVTQRTLTIRSVNSQNVAVWNYIPYWSQRNLTLAEALSGYEAREGDVIKSQNSFAMYSNRLGWIGSLTYMQPGRGYMLQRTGTSTATLQYPSEAVGARNARTRAQAAEAIDITPTSGRYARTMSLLATVEGIEAVEGDVLRIYLDDEFVGESPVICRNEAGQPLFFVSVAGDEERTFSATLERDGETLATAPAAGLFRADRVAGTMQAPTVISFAEGGEMGVFPSPFCEELNIRLRVDEAAKVDIRITAVDGSTVALFTDCADNGLVDIHWTGTASLSQGVYLVRIETDGDCEVVKVMKK